MKYLINHKTTAVSDVKDPVALSKKLSVPPDINTKGKFHKWCGSDKADYAFITHNIGSAPGKRVSAENPVVEVTGFIVDYDQPGDLEKAKKQINRICPSGKRPRYIGKTFSDCLRIVWEFSEPIRIAPEYYREFAEEMAKSLAAAKVAKGIDRCYENPSQVYALGHDWEDLGEVVSPDVPVGALTRAFDKQKSPGDIVEIPLDVIAKEVEKRFPNRWVGEFAPGARGPLFWIDDKVDRVGCRVDVDGRGMVVFSTREAKGFMSWRDIFGAKFVEEYSVKKTTPIMETWYHDGGCYFRQGMDLIPESVSERNAPVDMEMLGFSREKAKDEKLSECEKILHKIRLVNRVDAAVPVLYGSGMRVIGPAGNRLLNTCRTRAMDPAADGDPKHWPWTYEWLHQLFEPNSDNIDYFMAWLSRFYKATHAREIKQGQALILVGGTGIGKTLLTNKVMGDLCGGYEDAGKFLLGKTDFNANLAGVGVWSIQDTESAASYREHQILTKRLKRYVANPHIEYEPKFVERVSVPWGGRIILSLNEDPNSLSVVPSLDSSNRDKVLAVRMNAKARTDFPEHEVVAGILKKELPHFAKFLVDYQPKSAVMGDNRFGVKAFVDEFVESAAFDNSPRSYLAGMIDKFCIRQRNDEDYVPGKPWMGRLDDLIEHFSFDAAGRGVKPEMWRRSLSALAEASKANPQLRPIRVENTPNGPYWLINVDEKYDIIQKKAAEVAASAFMPGSPTAAPAKRAVL